jgi:hypothetical protein
VAEGGDEGEATGVHSGMPDVFISYASQDAAVANAVVAALERHGEFGGLPSRRQRGRTRGFKAARRGVVADRSGAARGGP